MTAIVSEYQEEILKFQEQQEQFVTEFFKEHASLMPVLMTFVRDTRNSSFGMVPIMIEGSMVNDDTQKEHLAKVILPGMLQKLESEGLVPLCTAWCTEAWFREFRQPDGTPMKKQDIPRNWRDLPKTEALIISFETAHGAHMVAYDVEREGEEGSPVVALHKRNMDDGKSFKGRFTNLFRKNIVTEN